MRSWPSSCALTSLVLIAAALVLTIAVPACGSSPSSGSTTSESAPTAAGGNNIVLGAGASFPYPLYSAWASDYKADTGIAVNYQSVGSSAGIEQITAKTVQFGASDAPLTPDELKAAGLFQFPGTIGGVSIIYNADGVKSGLRMDQATLAKIFLGEIKTWNDKSIAALNPGVTLPSTQITVVHRSDGSGTSWIFTNYLSAISSAWKSKVGAGQTVSWPTGVGGKGSDGVAQQVKTVPGGIGYVEYAYAKQASLTTVTLKNADGQWIAPSLAGFEAAADNADWANAPGLYLALVNQPGAGSYPIVGASFILVHTDTARAAEVQGVLKFYDWAYKNGVDRATALDYVAIPQSTVDLIEGLWKTELKSNGKAMWPAGS